MLIVGNDISKWQGDIDFNVYKNNSNFLIIKVSDGNGYVDPKFTRNQSECRRVGLPLGYYHFARPDLGNSPEVEAEFFLKTIGELRENEFLCLDYEPKSNPFPVVDWCKRFLDLVKSRTGCKPFIYLNKSQVRGYDWRPVAEEGYPLWLASYDGITIIGVWSFLAMHQWTSSQSVPGISGNVDGNWFMGDLKMLQEYGYHKPVTPSSSQSPSLSPSPSPSESSSVSPSNSQSLSTSPSASESPSPSASPSPSIEIPEIDYYRSIIARTCDVLNKKWTWVGKNGWKKRLAELKIIYHNI